MYKTYIATFALLTVIILPIFSHSAPQPVTIWVHGTRGTAIFPTGITEKSKEVEAYICAVPQGLTRAQDLTNECYTHTILHTFSASDPQSFPLEHCYAFGWSGALDKNERRNAARDLYGHLVNLSQQYKNQYGSSPDITIITHSHGGNVTLNLAAIVQEQQAAKNSFTVAQLILLGCPVLDETSEYAENQLFQKVYHLHSHADMPQVLDAQFMHHVPDFFRALPHKLHKAVTTRSTRPIHHLLNRLKARSFFSRRHFSQGKTIQARIAWQDVKPWTDQDLGIFLHYKNLCKSVLRTLPTQRDILHTEFIIPSFLEQLPTIIKKLSSDKEHNNNKEEVVILV